MINTPDKNNKTQDDVVAYTVRYGRVIGITALPMFIITLVVQIIMSRFHLIQVFVAMLSAGSFSSASLLFARALVAQDDKKYELISSTIMLALSICAIITLIRLYNHQ